MCPAGSVSNLTVSNRFHFPDFSIMCLIRICPMGSITRSNYSCVQSVLCRMLLCPIGPVNPMLLSCVQSKCVQSVLCPIVVCPIGSVSNSTVSNFFVSDNLYPIGLCPSPAKILLRMHGLSESAMEPFNEGHPHLYPSAIQCL